MWTRMSEVAVTAKPEVAFEDVALDDLKHFAKEPDMEAEVSRISLDEMLETSTDGDKARKLFNKRRTRSILREMAFKEFLAEHDFPSDDVNEPRYIDAGHHWFGLLTRYETVYPVHVAAALGNHEMLRMLLRAGANPNQKTSKGSTALDFAQIANRDGSHDQVLALLKSPVKLLRARDVLSLKVVSPTEAKKELPLSRDRRHAL